MYFNWVEITLSFLSLTVMEIVLSIDNILFISLITENIHSKYRSLVRRIGVLIAIVGRLGLLIGVAWLYKLNKPLFYIGNLDINFTDCINVIGGVYLVYYANITLFKEIKSPNKKSLDKVTKNHSIFKALLIIFLLDSIFSFDAVITAIAIGYNLYIMIAAVLVSVLVLLVSIDYVSEIITKNPNIKILVLSFLILVGFTLFLTAFDIKVPKVFLFSVMIFSAFVQIVSLKSLKNKIN